MKHWIVWFLGLLVIEGISFVVTFHSIANTIVAFIAGIILILVTVNNPIRGFSFLAIEYLIGSMGGLFRFLPDTENHGGFSLRMIFFLAFFLGWLFWSWKKRTYASWTKIVQGRTVYLALAFLIVYGVILGRIYGNTSLLQDANAWGVWLLLIPVVDIFTKISSQDLFFLRNAILAGFGWLFLKTVFVFFFFSHNFGLPIETIYLWLRRSGGGEITQILPQETMFRIFFQSHVYAIFFFLFSLAKLVLNSSSKLAQGLIVSSAFMLLISLSRSFWLGLGSGFLGLLIVLIWKRRQHSISNNVIWRCIWIPTVAFLCAGTFAFVLLWIHFPLEGINTSIRSLESRFDLSGSAISSRWNLLPVLIKTIRQSPILGYGFGKRITYQTDDLRIRKQNPDGWYTTYAFEWGWLDLWIKLGIFGPLAMLWILARIWKNLSSRVLPDWAMLGLRIGLIALAVTHAFTPYINHPLGIIYLIFLEGFTNLPQNTPDPFRLSAQESFSAHA